MQNLSIYSVIVLSAAAILPPLAAAIMGIVIHRHTRAMRIHNAAMQKANDDMGARLDQMVELAATPERIRQMAKEMRDSVTRIQEMP